MPFTAQCPNCRTAKFRVPWKRHEETMACPKCTHEFVLIPDDQPPDRSRSSVRTATSTSTVSVPVSAPVPSTIVAVPDSDDEPRNSFDPPLAVALASLGVIGLAVLLGQIPYGRFAAVAIAPIGALAALVSLNGLLKRRWLAWTSIAANSLVFLLMLLAPTWLGVTNWLPPADPNEGMNKVLSVGKDGSAPVPAEWVDASVAAWQQQDVRIDITAAKIIPLEPNAKTAEKKKRRGLKITVQVSNVGVARGLDCAPVNDKPVEIQLTTVTGQVVPWNKADSTIKTQTLFPGKSAEFSFIYDVPADAQADLRFEIPAGWAGNLDPVKFRIPMAIFARR